MDKNTLTGLILIGAVIISFMFLNKPNENNQPKDQSNSTVNLDAVKQDENTNISTQENIVFSSREESSLKADISDSISEFQNSLQLESLKENFGLFYKSANGISESYFLENDKIRLSFNSKGARITKAEMVEKNTDGEYLYKTHSAFVGDSNLPLALFEEETSQMSLTLVDAEKVIPIKTKDLYFQVFKQNDTCLIFRADAGSDDKYLEFVYCLSKGEYEVDFNINYHKIEYDINPSVDLSWSMLGLSTEKLADDERMYCSVMYRYFGASRDYLSERSDKSEKLEGNANWIAFKHKFFSSILISEDGFSSGTIDQKQLESDDYTISYASKLTIPSIGNVPLKFFFGPNDYDLLDSYNNEMGAIVNLGWGIFGWVNKFMIGPIFHFLKSLGIGFGLVILLLTLAVKVIISPLTFKNYMSSAKMKVLKPEISKINAKYEGKSDKNTAMKKQQETMALYRQTGVNPMAGCIPVVIQMPILFAVFRYFPASLDLRHQGFLWAEDLSSFDSILDLGFNIPLYGDHISLFTLLMAVSTLFYTMMNSSQMTPTPQPGMPNMKVIMYMFPIMMIFFFNSYSSGLSYYYLCGNLMNMGIMWGIKKYMVDEDKIRSQIETNKKKPKKKSKFQQKMEEISKQQQKKRK
jgi:YidC/Oxa1 family membrane protein insertase